MVAEEPADLTAILGEVRAGHPDAQDRLLRAIYDELRRTAAGLMRRERPDHTLQPSAVVHEALLRLLDGNALVDIPNRRYLFATTARAMRQVLIEHARRRQARKRDGDWARVPLDEALVGFDERGIDLIALHEALERLALGYPRQAQVVDLRFFGGLSIAEVAELMEVSTTTIESDWRFARAWLKGQLGTSEP
jgi:RNA polymerase sigma factor (TIGR02999 family)